MAIADITAAIERLGSGQVGATGGGAASEPNYLGVPDGYVAQKARVMTSRFDQARPDNYDRAPYTVQPPRYAKGAETQIGVGMSPEKRARIQTAMDQAGLYGESGSYRAGLWDDDTQKAFAKVLGYANQNGLDVDTALTELVSNPEVGPAARKARLGNQGDDGAVTELTPAGTLEAAVQNAAEQRLGRRLKGEEVSHFVSIYQGLEYTDNNAQVAAQRGAQGQAATGPEQGVAGKDTTLTPQAPGASAGAEGFINKEFSQEAAGQDVFGYYDVIKNLIGGG